MDLIGFIGSLISQKDIIRSLKKTLVSNIGSDLYAGATRNLSRHDTLTLSAAVVALKQLIKHQGDTIQDRNNTTHIG